MTEMLTSFESVVLAVGDLDAAVDSYTRLFGSPLSDSGSADGLDWARFELANVGLDLVSPAANAEDSWLTHWLERRGEGPLGLVFGTPDLDDTAARLSRAPLAVHEDIAPFGRALDLEATRAVPVWIRQSTERSAVVEPPSDQVFDLDHAVIRSRDADATRALYSEALGIRVAADRTFEQWGMRLVFCRLAGVTLEIASSTRDSDSGADRSAESTEAPPTADYDSLWGFTWQVSDIANARSRLDREGFDVSEVRDGRRPATRVFTVRDGTCSVPTLFIEHVA